MNHRLITIVAVDKNWAIGKNNNLLYHIPEDMRFFKETTSGKIVIYGYNTLISFPKSKPLPNRTNIVVCPETVKMENLITAHSIEEAVSVINNINDNRDAFICGGASIYGQMIDLSDFAYITKIHAETENADVFFPNLDKNDKWKIVEKSEKIQCKNGYEIEFYKYQNIAKKSGDNI